MNFNSPYSPFFTSGLLSPVPTASPRRGSLPTSPSSYTPQQDCDEASVFYFTLQPGRDSRQYRSFLSLDLAESQSSRSLSKPLRKPLPTLRMRASRDFNNPRLFPKPAPSNPIPAIPSQQPSASSSNHHPLVMRHQPSRSFPTLPLTAPLSKPADFGAQSQPRAYLPRRPSSTDPRPHIRAPPPAPLHLRGLSNADDSAARRASISTVSTGYRRDKRSAALAALEGRAPPTSPSSAIRYPFIAAIARGIEGTMTKRNFMSMSDDEDDGDDEDEGFEDGHDSDSSSDCGADDQDTDTDAQDLRRQFANYTLTPSMSSTASPAPSTAGPSPLSTPLLTPALPSASSSSNPPWLRLRMQSLAGDPLQSFIDLRDVDDEYARRNHSLLPKPSLSVRIGAM